MFFVFLLKSYEEITPKLFQISDVVASGGCFWNLFDSLEK